jgi:hypothetical protein
MAKTSAELMMERETRIAYGPVPHCLGDQPLSATSWQINGEEFLLRASGDHYFFYKKGQGIIVHRGPGADVSEELLWLSGSVYAAIASLNGLLPIHASSVAINGTVFAFTGPAGAGKSTLIAALGARGLPMFCDDTLVMDLADRHRIMCLPGHKRLKLAPDAIGLTGAKPLEKVSLTVEKFYCEPPSGEIGETLPLAKLIFLEEGPDPVITPIGGYERFERVHDDHYTNLLYAGAQEFDRGAEFDHLSRLANRVEMARFIRPRDRSRFGEGVELLVNYMTRGAETEFS